MKKGELGTLDCGRSQFREEVKKNDLIQIAKCRLSARTFLSLAYARDLRVRQAKMGLGPLAYKMVSSAKRIPPGIGRSLSSKEEGGLPLA